MVSASSKFCFLIHCIDLLLVEIPLSGVWSPFYSTLTTLFSIMATSCAIQRLQWQ